MTRFLSPLLALSLRTKLTLGFLGVTVLALLLITLLNTWLIRESLARQAASNLEQVSQTQALLMGEGG